MNFSRSQELFSQAVQLIPGGVHSPVRSFKGLGITPLFMERGEGGNIFDVDGNGYVDFCQSFGPLILGHSHPKVVSAIQKQASLGVSFGTAERYSLELAQLILGILKDCTGEQMQVRFVNSGTEAVMTAIRLARGATNRNKIIKFNGCYHGHHDSMLIKAGSGLAQQSEASSSGVPASLAQDTIVCDLGDYQQVEEAFAQYSGQIAAIIIEPLPANYGLLPQSQKFLQYLRDICSKNNSLLIFDEVISGFRVALAGMVEVTQILPDIITYGKIIGGGLPVGAVVARQQIMQELAPLGPVYQAGTLSGNPLAMVAGLTTLQLVQSEPQFYARLKDKTEKITAIFNQWIEKYSVQVEYKDLKNYHFFSAYSLFWPTEVENKDQASLPSSLSGFSNKFGTHFPLLFKLFLQKGVYLSPNAYEVGFVGSAHDEKKLSKQ